MAAATGATPSSGCTMSFTSVASCFAGFLRLLLFPLHGGAVGGIELEDRGRQSIGAAVVWQLHFVAELLVVRRAQLVLYVVAAEQLLDAVLEWRTVVGADGQLKDAMPPRLQRFDQP